MSTNYKRADGRLIEIDSTNPLASTSRLLAFYLSYANGLFAIWRYLDPTFYDGDGLANILMLQGTFMQGNILLTHGTSSQISLPDGDLKLSSLVF